MGVVPTFAGFWPLDLLLNLLAQVSSLVQRLVPGVGSLCHSWSLMGLTQTPCLVPPGTGPGQQLLPEDAPVYHALGLPHCAGRQRPSLVEELGSVLAASSASVNCVPARFDTI